ncbi:unnamed protein product [Blepharisma stoltei]|uniref:protein-serine/threonine phosphatase n=1 Tax=Blepharisma stoltei TaxID=1481888 RepID=A0AAU9K7N8_9CILI|nr:unnamed protein product [Blepharisma stoltei]
MQLFELKRRSKSYSNLPIINKKAKSSPVTPLAMDFFRKNTFNFNIESEKPINFPELGSSKASSYKSSNSMRTFNFTERPIPKLLPSTVSTGSFGEVRGYAANTHQGLVRTYNEDKALIILRIQHKDINEKYQHWPDCSFFGLYDGHGGHLCSNFLKENLHHFILDNHHFPLSPKKAIIHGFEKAEAKFTELAKLKGDNSGSCPLVVLIVGKKCYIANVGDSRAILSTQKGNETYNLSRDHRPADEAEHNRIRAAGGQVYISSKLNVKDHKAYRIFPGGLNVSRTIGDLNAKIEEHGGIPNVISSQPEIRTLKIKNDHDFIMMGCDGIFDVLSTKEVIETIWKSSVEEENMVSNACRKGVEAVISESMRKRSSDNLTAIIIALGGFEVFCRNLFTSRVLQE